MKKIFVLFISISGSFFIMNNAKAQSGKAGDVPSGNVATKVAEKPKPIVPGGESKAMDTRLPIKESNEQKQAAPPPAFKTAPVPAPPADRKPPVPITG